MGVSPKCVCSFFGLELIARYDGGFPSESEEITGSIGGAPATITLDPTNTTEQQKAARQSSR